MLRRSIGLPGADYAAVAGAVIVRWLSEGSIAPSEDELHEHAERERRRASLRAAFDEMGDQGKVIRLRHVDGLEWDEVAARLTAAGFTVDAVLASGDPAREITAAAEREKCDLIAMGTHGHRGVKDLIYGSVANEVRHQSMVPVLLVRERAGGGAG